MFINVYNNTTEAFLLVLLVVTREKLNFYRKQDFSDFFCLKYIGLIYI